MTDVKVIPTAASLSCTCVTKLVKEVLTDSQISSIVVLKLSDVVQRVAKAATTSPTAATIASIGADTPAAVADSAPSAV